MKIQTQQIVSRARAAKKAGDFVRASALLGKAVASEPDNLSLQLEQAHALFAQRKLRDAAHILHTLHLKHPEHRGIWRDCGTVYIQLGEFPLAEQFLKKCVGTDPSDYDSWRSLCFVAGSSMKHTDAIFYAMQALQLQPLDPDAHNNLGSVLLAVGRLDDALVSFDTVLKLQPERLDALSNIATTLSLKGDPAGALKIYGDCLAKAQPESDFAKALRYRMSYDYFRTGDLKSGWEGYDYGFFPTDLRSRTPKRSFHVPKWEGQTLGSEKLLVWREQGLGDELMFLSVLNEALQRCPNIILECDERLVIPLARSFPQVEVRRQAMALPDLQSIHNDFDFHVPVGSLMQFFRGSTEDFSRSQPYVAPSSERKKVFSDWLKSLPNPIKIGLCWRSGKLNAERNSSYIPISDLEPLFHLPGIDFINLQYGDCEEELRNVADHFGVVVHQAPDLDLKDDLDGVFALISCMDHVISAKTAVAEMSPAVGTPTSVFMRPQAWTLFGQNRYIFYPSVTLFLPEEGETLAQVVPRIADNLRDHFARG